MEHFIEFLIFGFTVFIAMNQLFDIALLFQGSGSYAFYGIPVLADNTNQVGERFLIYTNRIDKVDTAVDDSDFIAGCNIQSTHLSQSILQFYCMQFTRVRNIRIGMSRETVFFDI